MRSTARKESTQKFNVLSIFDQFYPAHIRKTNIWVWMNQTAKSGSRTLEFCGRF